MSDKLEDNKKNPLAMQDTLFEARKMVYGHCVDMHKYFLTWRERLLAGYAAILAALAIAFSWAYNIEKSTYFSRAICVAGMVFTVIFWLLDRRNRTLYRVCINVASNIENQLGIVSHDKQKKICLGLYSSLCMSYKKSQAMIEVRETTNKLNRIYRWALSHSGAIDILAFLVFFGLAFLLKWPPEHPLDKQTASTSSTVIVSNPSKETVPIEKKEGGAQPGMIKGSGVKP